MGLFDKKYCDICGEKIGLLGNRKLKDGNLCKDCAAKLSPFFSERKESTVEEIKEQLEYREANKEKVASFHPTRVIGGNMTLAVDEGQKLWLASRSSKWQNANPDILEFRQVTGVDYIVDETRSEIKQIIRNTAGLCKVKIIIEAPVLTEEEIVRVTTIAAEEGAFCIKTATGFSGPTTPEMVKTVKRALGTQKKEEPILIKAAGGIKTREDIYTMIRAGADLIGTSTMIEIE